jgi:hypothetical protein
LFVRVKSSQIEQGARRALKADGLRNVDTVWNEGHWLVKPMPSDVVFLGLCRGMKAADPIKSRSLDHLPERDLEPRSTLECRMRKRASWRANQRPIRKPRNPSRVHGGHHPEVVRVKNGGSAFDCVCSQGSKQMTTVPELCTSKVNGKSLYESWYLPVVANIEHRKRDVLSKPNQCFAQADHRVRRAGG